MSLSSLRRLSGVFALALLAANCGKSTPAEPTPSPTPTPAAGAHSDSRALAHAR